MDLFRRFSTQWRAGMGGAYGLDYTVFFHELDRMQLVADEYDAMVHALHTIESVALEEMSKN